MPSTTAMVVATPAPCRARAATSTACPSATRRDGLVTRTVYPTVPPRAEYAITPVAREPYETLLQLTAWAERHRRTIARCRVAYDAAQAEEARPAAVLGA